jgi:3-oxoacyl-(acyl-carrier-protein) synthase
MIGGAMSIGEAYRLIKDGYQDIIISGGIDSNGRFSHEMKLLGALSS